MHDPIHQMLTVTNCLLLPIAHCYQLLTVKDEIF